MSDLVKLFKNSERIVSLAKNDYSDYIGKRNLFGLMNLLGT